MGGGQLQAISVDSGWLILLFTHSRGSKGHFHPEIQAQHSHTLLPGLSFLSKTLLSSFLYVLR